MKRTTNIERRLAAIRKNIVAENVSMDEIAELQNELVEHIDPSDMLLLEWAGVPEKATYYTDSERWSTRNGEVINHEAN